MEERIRMMLDYDTGNWGVWELCRRYGVSRDTFHEWRKRRHAAEPDWFIDRPHAAAHCPHRTDPELAAIGAIGAPAVSAFWALVVLRRQAPERACP